MIAQEIADRRGPEVLELIRRLTGCDVRTAAIVLAGLSELIAARQPVNARRWIVHRTGCDGPTSLAVLDGVLAIFTDSLTELRLRRSTPKEIH